VDVLRLAILGHCSGSHKGFLSALLPESAKFTVVVNQNFLNNSPSEDPPQCQTEPAENERGTDGT